MEFSEILRLAPVLAALVLLIGGLRRLIARGRTPPHERPPQAPFPWGAFLRATLRHILLAAGLAMAALFLFALLGGEPAG